MSIFQFRGPLLPDSQLYKGRQADLNKLLRWCQGEVQHYGIVFGARQSGKSSLLLRLEQQLSATHVVCFSNFQHLSDASPAQVFESLAQDLAESFSLLKPAGAIPDSRHFSEYVCDLLDTHPNQRAVVLIEELGVPPKASRLALANTLRALFNDRQRPARRMLSRLMVIVAGNTELYDLAYTDVSPFANICENHYLVDLSETEAVGLVEDGLTMLGVHHKQSVQLGASVYRLAHGYPYLTQRLGHALEVAVESGEPLDDLILEKAADELITCGDPVVSHLQKVLTEHDLFPAARSILAEKIRFNRHEEAMAYLELAGFIRPDDGYWQVRNQLYDRAVRNWLDASIQPDESPLARGLVRIFGRKGIPVGAGFLVDRNHVVTCAHVVEAALDTQDAQDGVNIALDFPLLKGNSSRTAKVYRLETYEAGKADDFAILELTSPAPTGALPLAFGKVPAKWGGTFRVCGFPAGREDGAWSTGVMRGPISDGRNQLEDTKSTGYAVQPGFSGSPVWDETAGGVIGMVVATDTDVKAKAAFMIPTQIIQQFLKE